MDDQTRYTKLCFTIDTLISRLEHDVLNKASVPFLDQLGERYDEIQNTVLHFEK